MKFNVVMNSSTGEIMITVPDGPNDKRIRKTMRAIKEMIKEDHGFEIIIKDLSEETSERIFWEKQLS